MLEQRISLPIRPFPYLNRQRVPNRDVGFLEIANDARIPRLPMHCIALDTPPIPSDPRNPGDLSSVVIGYPYGESSLRAGGRSLRLQNFASYVARASEDEYILPWPLSRYSFELPGEQLRSEEVTWGPHGYSGGGLWVIHDPPAGGYSLPDNMLKLHAIQSRFVHGRGVSSVSCIPVRHWLQLIYDHYHDLRPVLSQQFLTLQTE